MNSNIHCFQVKRQHRKMYQKSCKNGSSSHLSLEDSAVTTTTCNNDESAVDKLISEKAKVGSMSMRAAVHRGE